MRRSREVPLTILATLALTSLSACHDTPGNCVDAQNRIAPNYNCQSHGGYMGSGFHYIYGGSSGGRIGDAVIGGSITRGGFGGFGGEGGAHGGGGE